MNIGQKIKKLRKSKGITQKELANRVDVSQAFISSVENNKKNISIEKLKKICNNVLKIKLCELFNKSQFKKNQQGLTETTNNLKKDLKLFLMKKNEIYDEKIFKKSKSLDKLLDECYDKRKE